VRVLKRYILTGAPGAGKTSVLRALNAGVGYAGLHAGPGARYLGHEEAYGELGFDLVDVPAGDVAARAVQIDEAIRSVVSA
jgi:predicted ATPase